MMLWRPARKLIHEIDTKTIEQREKASNAKLLSELQQELGNDIADRLAFFGEKNHFAESLGKVFKGA